MRDRLRRQQPHPVELAAVQQHLAESQVVARRSTPRRRRRNASGARPPGVAHRRPLAGLRIDLRLGEAGGRPPGRGETGVGHAERAGDAPAIEIAERLARDDLDDAAEHIGRHAVFPGRARLEHQWQPRQFARPVRRWSGLVHDVRVAPQQLHRRVAEIRVGQPRGVAQQILHGHCALRLRALDADGHLGEFRQVVRRPARRYRGGLPRPASSPRPRRSAWSSRRCGRPRPNSAAPWPRGRGSRTPRHSRPARRARSPAPRPGSASARHPAG